MTSTKAQTLRIKIMKDIQSLDIAGYLFQEVESILHYLHYYKLQNISNNLADLKDFLVYLDQQNSKQILELDIDEGNQKIHTDQDVHYFISKIGFKDLTQPTKDLLVGYSHELHNIMMGIKGFLLLTADKFCSASSTRIWIDQREFAKQFVE